MSRQPVLYGFSVSPHVRAARIAFLEKGIDHRFEEIAPDGLASDGYAKINPFRQMPALVLEQGVLYETPALLTWSDAINTAIELQPTDPYEIGQMWKFIGIAQNRLYKTGVMHLYFHRVLAKVFGMEPDTDAADAAVTPTLTALDVVESALHDGHLAGPSLSLADIYCGTMVDYVARTRDGAEALAARPKTCAWLEALRQRESFKTTFAPMLVGTDQR